VGTTVPFIDLTREYEAIRAEVEPAVGRVLASGRYILGPEVRAFEEELAAYCDAAHGIGVASGTDALMIALKAVGVGPGDEVVVPAFTFVATAEVVTNLGATPIFADVDPDRLTLDPADTARRLTSRTKAIVPVHLYGRPAEMAPLLDLAARHGAFVVEDAAQAVGATYRGRKAGSLGHLACFSFFPTKNLGAYGDGGLITTNDGALADRVRMLRAHGSRERYFHESPGWCSRLDEIQAAALRVKLRHLDAWTERRRALAERYHVGLGGLPLDVPGESLDERAVYHLFTVRTSRRDELKKHLDREGIGSAVHYPLPLHRQPVYRDASVTLPGSERASHEVLSVPLFAYLGDGEQDAVIASIRAFFDPPS
jgi:dTDP-4-amino-4,6-dideoxygalactose transaminase